MVEQKKAWKGGFIPPPLKSSLPAFVQQTPGDRMREDIRASKEVKDAVIASTLLDEYRPVSPKMLTFEDVSQVGANPAIAYVMTSSNQIPQDHCFHAYMIEHQMTVYDGSLLGLTAVQANYFAMYDLAAFHGSTIMIQGVSIPAALTVPEIHSRIFLVDYWFPHGTIISLFTLTNYVGGGAGTTMRHRVTIWGEILKMPTYMARGTGETYPATAANWAIVLAKFSNWP